MGTFLHSPNNRLIHLSRNAFIYQHTNDAQPHAINAITIVMQLVALEIAFIPYISYVQLMLLLSLKIENNIKLKEECRRYKVQSHWLFAMVCLSYSWCRVHCGRTFRQKFLFEKLLSVGTWFDGGCAYACRLEEVCLSWSMSATHHKQYWDNLQPHEP